MSITINICYRGTNGHARAFAEEINASGTVDRIREKEGNLRYEYFFPSTIRKQFCSSTVGRIRKPWTNITLPP